MPLKLVCSFYRPSTSPCRQKRPPLPGPLRGWIHAGVLGSGRLCSRLQSPPELRGGGEMVETTCAFLNTRPSPGFSRIPGRTRAPLRLWGFTSAPRPPWLAQAAAQPPPSIQGRASGREREPGWLFARLPPRSLLSRFGFCAFSFSADTQPRDCASSCSQSFKGREQGPRHTRCRRTPAPPTRAALPPPQVPSPAARPHRAHGPAGGALGRPRGAQQLPQPDAGAARQNAPSRRRRC